MSDLITKLEGAAYTIQGLVVKKISNYKPHNIYHTGGFRDNLVNQVKESGEMITMTFWSNVPHTKYVLGGKVPSWTPIAPIKQWVVDKRLSWVDKDTKKALTVMQMAYLVRGSIKNKGIKERNVFQEVFKEDWDKIERIIINSLK